MDIKQYIEEVRKNAMIHLMIDYYNGHQWKGSKETSYDSITRNKRVLGWEENSDITSLPITRLGTHPYDKVDPYYKKVYNRVTINLIEEGINFWNFLLEGIGSNPYFSILEENEEKKLKFLENIKKHKVLPALKEAIISSLLHNRGAVIFQKEEGSDIATFSALEAHQVYKEKNILFATTSMEDNKDITLRIDLSTNEVKMYKDKAEIPQNLEYGKDFYIIYKELSSRLITINSLELQDAVNIHEVRLNDKEKSWVNPIRTITGIDDKTMKKISASKTKELYAGAGNTTIIPGENSKMDSYETEGVDEAATERGKSKRHDFFHSINLGGIKTSQNGTIDPSGYAKELDTLEVHAMAESLQNFVMDFVMDIFETTNKNEGFELFPLTLKRNETILSTLKREENMKKRYEREEKKIAFQRDKIAFYVEIGKTKEEAIELAMQDAENIEKN